MTVFPLLILWNPFLLSCRLYLFRKTPGYGFFRNLFSSWEHVYMYSFFFCFQRNYCWYSPWWTQSMCYYAPLLQESILKAKNKSVPHQVCLLFLCYFPTLLANSKPHYGSSVNRMEQIFILQCMRLSTGMLFLLTPVWQTLFQGSKQTRWKDEGSSGLHSQTSHRSCPNLYRNYSPVVWLFMLFSE